MKFSLKITTFLISIVSILMVMGCTSTNTVSSTQIESVVEPSPAPREMTTSEIEELQAKLSPSFIFYNSFASW